MLSSLSNSKHQLEGLLNGELEDVQYTDGLVSQGPPLLLLQLIAPCLSKDK